MAPTWVLVLHKDVGGYGGGEVGGSRSVEHDVTAEAIAVCQQMPIAAMAE